MPEKPESSRALAAFELYRSLPPAERSIDAAYAKSRGQQVGAKRAPGRWTTWARVHRWVERAKAHDEELARASIDGRKKAVSDAAEMLERQRLAFVKLEIVTAFNGLRLVNDSYQAGQSGGGLAATHRIAGNSGRRALGLPLGSVDDAINRNEMFEVEDVQLPAGATPANAIDAPASDGDDAP